MAIKYATVLILFLSLQMCHPGELPMKDQEQAHTNALIHESSPYLLQHAHNPVNWQPWGKEALNQAAKEDKLLIISIGYAACHWCHVMEHESFEDTAVAKIMNEHFIPIKVDREERPDVDDVYMTACNLVSGRGGWPLNAFALPDGRPIWAGTYFPKDQWISILNQFIRLKDENMERLEDSADKITKGIQAVDDLGMAPRVQEYSESELQTITTRFVAQIDLTYGGRSGAPKFPMPNNYEFLLKYHGLTNDDAALKAVQVTLDEMANGGIYDQVGGGFARYSVDDKWKVPHFEKMLYDNGQLVSLYADMYRQTKKPRYKEIIEQTLEFIQREMTSRDGGFFSSLDADSEGEEGKFYIWTKPELDSLLGGINGYEAVLEYYNVVENGNWEDDSNILFITKAVEDITTKHKLSEESFELALKSSKKVLLNARQNRVRPGLDDKILTSWNALMIKGYIDAYKALGTKEYLITAQRATNFLLKNQMAGDHRLNRNYKDGKSSINGFLDDYALFIQSLVALYEVTFEEEWLNHAVNLAKYAIEHFLNEDNSMFFYTSDKDPPLVARKMEINDNVIPASNSTIARNLHKLGELFYNERFSEISLQMMANMKQTILDVREPSFYSNWCQLYMDLVHSPFEIAIVGENAAQLRDTMIREYLPTAMFLGGRDEGSLPLLKGKLDKYGTFIYVCRNKVCKFPVETVDDAFSLLD